MAMMRKGQQLRKRLTVMISGAKPPSSPTESRQRRMSGHAG